MTIDPELRNQARKPHEFPSLFVLLNLVSIFFLYFLSSSLGDEVLSGGVTGTPSDTPRQVRLMVFSMCFIRIISQMVWAINLSTYTLPSAFTILVVFVENALDSVAILMTLKSRREAWPLFDNLVLFFFFLGVLLERIPEFDRVLFKSRKENKGKMHIVGFHSYLVHPNYLGYLVWRSSLFAFSSVVQLQLLVVLIFAEFFFGDVRAQKARNVAKYGEEFKRYWDTTFKLIPFVY
jgi:steroid 5-alpha reductase family enzyme